MAKKTRRLFEELDSMAMPRDRDHMIESRAQHVMASATNLINLINESYDDESASELKRKLLLAIKNQNPSKFNNGLRRMTNENRRTSRSG